MSHESEALLGGVDLTTLEAYVTKPCIFPPWHLPFASIVTLPL